mmetsp:Transcript_21641/g.47346  ORF Transcript_21641/g.47346 Transcript_21641/m.47346 type:complete len:100 (+) Transcript_21641:66-365(+)
MNQAPTWGTMLRVACLVVLAALLPDLLQLRLTPKTDRPVLKGRVPPELPVPVHIPKPSWYHDRRAPSSPAGVQVHDEQGVERMRAAGSLVAQALRCDNC